MNRIPTSALKPRRSLSLALAAFVMCCLISARAEAQPKVRRGREILLSTDSSNLGARVGMLSAAGLRMPPGARVVRVSHDGKLATVSVAKPGRGRIGEFIPLDRAKISRFCGQILALNPGFSMDCEANLIVRARADSCLSE